MDLIGYLAPKNLRTYITGLGACGRSSYRKIYLKGGEKGNKVIGYVGKKRKGQAAKSESHICKKWNDWNI